MLFSKVGTVFLTLLRWLTMTSLIIMFISPFTKCKSYKQISVFFALLICLLNIIFYYPNMNAMVGKNFAFWNFRNIEFMLELAIVAGVSSFGLFEIIKNKNFPTKREIGTMRSVSQNWINCTKNTVMQ